MSKVVGGIIIGFFLALLVVFSSIYVMLSPYQSQITALYMATQSQDYQNMINLLNGLKGLAGNPILNTLTLGTSGNYANGINNIQTFMEQSRQSISILYMFVTYALPIMLFSLLMVFVGIYIVHISEKHDTKKETKTTKGSIIKTKWETATHIAAVLGLVSIFLMFVIGFWFLFLLIAFIILTTSFTIMDYIEKGRVKKKKGR